MATRLDTMQQMDPGAADPIGTKAEVKALGLPLVKYASCSEPGKKNRGCAFFNHPELGPCPVRALLARRGRPGPENVATLTMKSPTSGKEDAMPCYTYMAYLHRMDERIGLNHIIGIGGDKTIKRRTTEPVDPKNPRGGRTRVVFVPEAVERLPRPEVSMAERVESFRMAREIHDSRLERTMAAMDDDNTASEREEDGDDLELDDDDIEVSAAEPAVEVTEALVTSAGNRPMPDLGADDLDD